MSPAPKNFMFKKIPKKFILYFRNSHHTSINICKLYKKNKLKYVSNF